MPTGAPGPGQVYKQLEARHRVSSPGGSNQPGPAVSGAGALSGHQGSGTGPPGPARMLPSGGPHPRRVRTRIASQDAAIDREHPLAPGQRAAAPSADRGAGLIAANAGGGSDSWAG
ncbi:hypothetical protein H696_05691 [Fonticula alba]|uniref:Uncharacterized protein n=1 Tax=Fonticula alba TaxID=691883 RepID=A0A058Z1D7_FONAL|nr:hypothetical protein H696_05691 [Fonticula alba]KCV67753.1 hypothetical protein H696_05691 [Fonticula alba]|eukprot:XP_009497784.1 hypothetical protein H696_05691 [Fonticula alba]